MEKFRTVKEFASFRRLVAGELGAQDKSPTLVTCAGTCGQLSGASDVIRIIKKEIASRNLQGKIHLSITGCQGLCELNPFILVEPAGHLYPKVKLASVPQIVDAALAGRPVTELLLRGPGGDGPYVSLSEIPFLRKQRRTVLGMNRLIDPIRIMDYIRQGGYGALEEILARNDPAWVVSEVVKSGLRGRGGAGFPTGTKWRLAAGAGKGSRDKFVVCNADEGDPGAYMDRGLLEGNPHIVLEGMMIAAFAIGADKGIVYVRTEYPLAIKHVLIAIRQAREFGLLGQDVLGSGLDFDVEIVRGAGAFVCGEETALIRSIEGSRPEPRERPPYPIEKGIRGRPTCINNVETLANIPILFKEGAESFARVGTEKNTGTKIFSLVGKIRNTGLVEVPLGTPIGTVVHDIGGGPPGKAPIKAVQTGGPSGGCIPSWLFHLPLDYEALARAGSIMGSGGMIVMDETTCMVDVARYFTKFLMEESCGKCFPCRKGTQRMYELLDDICRGTATAATLPLLEELANAVRDTTMCGLGRTAPNPVLSTLRYFRSEYEEHVNHRRCPAGVCPALTRFRVNERCNGCTICKPVCPVEAISGELKRPHVIDQEKCIHCRACADTCKRDAIDAIDTIALAELTAFHTARPQPEVNEP